MIFAAFKEVEYVSILHKLIGVFALPQRLTKTKSEVNQNKRTMPSPISRMPDRHAIGRIGVRIFVPSLPFSNLVVGKGAQDMRMEVTVDSETKHHNPTKKNTIIYQSSKKPHPPTNVEPVGSLDLVHREICTEVLGRNAMLALLLILFFFFF